MSKIDTASIDSFGIWYGTSAADTVPNFGNAANTQWFKLSALYANNHCQRRQRHHQRCKYCNSIPACRKSFSGCCAQRQEPQVKPCEYRLFLCGSEPPCKSDCSCGTGSVSEPDTSLVEAGERRERGSIRFWYGTTGKVPVNQADFTLPPYDSISAASVVDTQLLVSGLQYQTHYYFGGQVFLNGQWSYVTDSASADAVTPAGIGKLAVNSVKITSLTFDTATNAIRVKWNVDDTLPDTLEIWISYSLSGYPTVDTSAHQTILVTAATGDTVVKLREPLVFSPSAADTTFYYVALWESRFNGLLTDPTDSSEMRVASPTYDWQQVTYFTKSPGDTNSVFDGNILIVTGGVAQADVAPTTGIIRYASGLTPAAFPGFVQMSVPFYFSKYQSSAPFTIDLKLFAFPANLHRVIGSHLST